MIHIHYAPVPDEFNINKMQNDWLMKIAQSMAIPPDLISTEKTVSKDKPKTEDENGSSSDRTQRILEWLPGQDLSLSGNKLAVKLKKDLDITISGTYINRLKNQVN